MTARASEDLPRAARAVIRVAHHMHHWAWRSEPIALACGLDRVDTDLDIEREIDQIDQARLTA